MGRMDGHSSRGALGEDDSDNKFGRHEKQMNKLIHWATVKQVRNVARGKIEFIECQPLSIGPQEEKIQCELILAKGAY